VARWAPLRFAFEAAILVVVGVVLAAAGVDLVPFAVIMAVALLLVATAERMMSRPRVEPLSFGRSALAGEGGPPLVQRSHVSDAESRRVGPEPPPVEQPEQEPQRVLAAVPEPEPEPEEEEDVEELVPALSQAAHRRPEGWNLWDLELRASERAGENRLRDEEWHALFVSLREYARPDGTLPSDFDALVQDSFAELISRRA
jgi:hypothetical protein